MSFNLSKHQLVPKHAKISDTEKKKLFEAYGIESRSLPKILKDDPAIAKLELKAGDIVKVERASKTAGVAYYYRVVADE